MKFVSRYVSHQPDAQGFITYSSEENEVWHRLFARQMNIIPGRACDTFLKGIKQLRLCEKNIPQLPDISETLFAASGWEVAPVAALISAEAFFRLLSQRKFPAATFIRSVEEIDYVTEPDIFHELFGHCPMLIDQSYADFLQEYACMVLQSPQADWPYLQRLFWYTVEFGLIRTNKGLKAYGGGILSSITETPHCIESNLPMRVFFDPLVALRMPYRIDQLQAVYYVIESYKTLRKLIESDLSELIQEARRLGEFPPLFPLEKDNPNIHLLAC